MSETDERPSISERYGVCIGSGVQTDVVLAAGMQRNRIGILLLRLQAEYDSVRADLERAGHIRGRNVDAGRELERRAVAADKAAIAAENAHDPAEAAHWLRIAEQLRAQAAELITTRTAAEIISARAFILLELKTLFTTKQHVGALSLRMAAKRGNSLKPDVALKLGGRVLDVYLDPICHHCDGTGRVGNRYAGENEKECRACKGTGHRRDILGSGPQETTFAAVLLGELDRQAKDAARRMAGALFGQAPAQMQPEQERVLRQVLADSIGQINCEAAHAD